MILEALRWYVESLAAFWVGLAGGGLPKLILVCFLIYWICGRRRGRCHRCRCRCRCPHCGCRCGRCPCEKAEEAETAE